MFPLSFSGFGLTGPPESRIESDPKESWRLVSCEEDTTYRLNTATGGDALGGVPAEKEAAFGEPWEAT